MTTTKPSSGYHLPDVTYSRFKFRVPSDRGSVDIKLVAEKLDKHGVCIVSKLFSNEASKDMFSCIMDDIKKNVPGFDYQDKKTWPFLLERMRPTHGLIVQNFGFGWLQSIVDIRTHPYIAQLYAQLYSHYDSKTYDMTNDMFSSSDGFSVSLKQDPNVVARESGEKKVSKAGYYGGKDWLHFDQKPSEKVRSIQGFLNLKDVENELGATFCFISESHKHQEEFAQKFLATEKEEDPRFYRLKNDDEVQFFLEKGHYWALLLEEGDFVLWNSKLIHQGRPHVFDMEKTSNDLERCVVYAAYQPRCYATKGDLRMKKKAFDELRTTTHNASFGVELFAAEPRLYSAEEQDKRKKGFYATKLATHPSMTISQMMLFLP